MTPFQQAALRAGCFPLVFLSAVAELAAPSAVKLLPLLKSLLMLGLAAGLSQSLRASEPPLAWGDPVWQLQIDPASGALVHIENRNDAQHMNWLREAGRWDHGQWLPDASPGAMTLDGRWGLVETARTGLLPAAQVHPLSDRAWEAVYTSPGLTVTARRELDAHGDLAESYTFQNTGAAALDLPVGSVSITAPLFDQYPDAERSLAARCHAHLWMGGSSAWINATRMGNQGPHLGLVVTRGSLDAYSQRGGRFSDRGVFLLHPAAMNIAPGKSVTLAWTLFWHAGWDDFFSRLLATQEFIRLMARDYTVTAGQPLEITAESAAPLDSARVLANGKPVEARLRGNCLSATVPTTAPGEVFVELHEGSRRTWLRANVVPPVDDLLAARVRFIVRRQQRDAPGDALDGAYLSYDNETGRQVCDPGDNDHNAGRERLGMGVLGALYLPLCRDEVFQGELKESLRHYAAFVARELEDEAGVVYGAVGRRDAGRLYNFPWVAHFYLAMYRATGDADQLDCFVRVIRSYYARGGAKHLSIGIPVVEGLQTLEKAGRTREKDELLALFRTQADYLLKIGLHYPSHEVNYEQSIVAPAVQLLAETYLVTGDKSYLEGAKRQMPVLEAFCGKQPDHRLDEVAIRHWDDYWFGKMKLYGDTLPHYWSTLNAVAYADYGRGTGETGWFRRADAVLKANLSLFNPDGSASCAHLYADATNGHPAARNDPWANDQDWALVNLLTVRAMAGW